MPVATYSDVATALLEPYGNIERLVHIASSEQPSASGDKPWLAKHASHHTRWTVSSTGQLSEHGHGSVDTQLDVIIDDVTEGLPSRLVTLWPRLKPGGAYLFPLEPAVVAGVRAWIFALSGRLGMEAPGHLHRNYMGKTTKWYHLGSQELAKYPLPSHASLLFCAASGCGVAKVGPCDCIPAANELKACANAKPPFAPALAACNTSSWRNANAFALARTGMSLRPICDKIDHSAYHVMYGALLTPLASTLRSSNRPLRLFEVGLGCDQGYGPGASVALWKRHYQGLELWEAEYNEACVKASRARGQLQDVFTVTGDQGDPAVLKGWREAMGNASFDAVIDDGGHKNSQKGATFDWFWPATNPGGVYFIEDMHVDYMSHYEDTNGKAIFTDVVRDWLSQLAGVSINNATGKPFDGRRQLPAETRFIACQTRACAIGKARADA